MLVACPKCKTRFRIDDGKVREEGIKLRCTKCATIFRVMRKPAVAAPTLAPPPAPAAPSPAPPVPAPAGDTTILIGHESPSFCRAVEGVLEFEPYRVVSFHDGVEVLEAVRNLKPQVVLLDVALPRMFGFEVCEAIRHDPTLGGVKIILIAAIYDKTRYKRNPNSLYGADDYIEKHHIPDDLAAKINRLLSGQQAVEKEEEEKPAPEEQVTVSRQPVTAEERAQQSAAREELKKDEELPAAAPPVAAAPEQLSEAHLKAKRLARIIVSDISLYNQGKLEEGVRNGTFFELLENDVKEGRALYERRIPEDIRLATRYLDDAFDDLMAKVRKEFNL